jgi:AraC-like DNA-binding protein
MFVRNELNRLSLHGVSVEINEIRTDEKLTPSQYETLREVLKQAGVELFEDKKDILVQRIKNVIMEIVNLFSETQHVTIERFYICHKIERVKELLLHEKMKLTEIAHKMHYSSLAHLSNQFKKITGLTTSQFKEQYRKNL